MSTSISNSNHFFYKYQLPQEITESLLAKSNSAELMRKEGVMFKIAKQEDHPDLDLYWNVRIAFQINAEKKITGLFLRAYSENMLIAWVTPIQGRYYLWTTGAQTVTIAQEELPFPEFFRTIIEGEKVADPLPSFKPTHFDQVELLQEFFQGHEDLFPCAIKTLSPLPPPAPPKPVSPNPPNPPQGEGDASYSYPRWIGLALLTVATIYLINRYRAQNDGGKS